MSGADRVGRAATAGLRAVGLWVAFASPATLALWGQRWSFAGMPTLVAAVTAVVAVVAVAGRSARRPVGLAIAVLLLLAGVAAAAPGRFVAIWLVAAFAVSTWGILGRAPVPGLPDARGAEVPLIVVALLVGHRSIYHPMNHALAAGHLLVGASIVSACAFRPRAVVRLATLARRGAGRGATVISAAALGVATVAVPGLADRVVRRDPLARFGGGSWQARTRTGADPAAPWAPAPRWTDAPPVERLRTLGAASLTAIALLAPIAIGWSAIERPSPPLLPPPPPNPTAGRLVAEPWFGEFNRESSEIYTDSYISQYVGLEIPDHEGRYLNVLDGIRRSWAPAPCRRPLQVWMFGGSTVYGVGNRDDHTLPSELARAADAEGVPLALSNFGVPGDVTWQQSARLQRALRQVEVEPDVVIFFGGANDGNFVLPMNGTDRLGLGDFIGPLDRIHMTLISNLSVAAARGEYTLTPRPPRAPKTYGPELVARRAQQQIVAGDRLARAALAGREVAFHHVFQPVVALRSTPHPEESTPTPQETEHFERVRDLLPATIVDLSATFDAIEGPFYVDGVHVVEDGNRVIAEALWDHLGSDLRSLARERGASCS